MHGHRKKQVNLSNKFDSVGSHQPTILSPTNNIDTNSFIIKYIHCHNDPEL